MTQLRLVSASPADCSVDALVIGVHRGSQGTPVVAKEAAEVIAAFSGPADAGGVRGTTDAADPLTTALAALRATGTAGEVTRLATFGAITAPVLAVAGLGEPGAAAQTGTGDTGKDAASRDTANETLRRATGSAVRALAGASTVAVAMPGSADPETLAAIAEGALLGAYQFAGYHGKPDPDRLAPVGEILLIVPDAEDPLLVAAADRARIVAEATNLSRDWVNVPGNDQRPPVFAATITEAAALPGITSEVIGADELRSRGFGGILAVGDGSAAAPCLVVLRYTPLERPELTDLPKIALVGKGITFDAGGLSIKTPGNMWTMKSDMGGAAATAAAMLAIARLRLPVEVTAYLPIAENMLSGSAYRPGDVVRMYDGTYVEVLNTDAEGRLVLADAIVLAGEDSPDYLFEVSTLTGGQVVALGRSVIGVMGSQDLCEQIVEAGQRTGEPMWIMPMLDDIRTTLDSDVADILQVSAGMDRAGHMLQGGLFLERFVPDGVPWAHIDIAGPSFRTSDAAGYLPKGGTGVPVRTLVRLVEDLAGGAAQ